MSVMTSIIIFSSAIVLILLFYISRLGHRNASRKAPSLYIEALHELIEGNLDMALQKLKQTVKSDTENIMAYILLGDVLRKKGFPLKASKVHRNLLVRTHLSKTQINTILYHLIKDYHESGDLEKAVEVADRLQQSNKNDSSLKHLIIKLYEEKEDWDKAFFYRQSLNKWLKKKDQDILALYKMEAGLKLPGTGREHERRIRFREAIKLDKHCIPAYLYWSDSYYRENRLQDAFKVIKEFIHHNTEYAHLAIDRLKTILYDLGKYNDLESMLIPIIKKKPKDPTANIYLLELYQKQGRRDSATNLAEKIQEVYPDHLRSKIGLMKLYVKQGQSERAMKEASQIIEEHIAHQLNYSCSACGYESAVPLWRCPKCHQWKSFLD